MSDWNSAKVCNHENFLAAKKPVLYPTVNDEWEAEDDLKPLINPIKVSFFYFLHIERTFLSVLNLMIKLFNTVFQQEKSLERRRKLREKRKKAREAKKRLLLPVKDGISKMKDLVEKRNNKRTGFGGVKQKPKSQTEISKKSKLHRSIKVQKKTKQKEI